MKMNEKCLHTKNHSLNLLLFVWSRTDCVNETHTQNSPIGKKIRPQNYDTSSQRKCVSKK